MSENVQIICDLLKRLGIGFKIVEHTAVFTVDDLAALDLADFESVAKNLFVRDDKKRNYYLIVVRHEKSVDLKAVSEKIGSRKLSFASENDLTSILGLQTGAVSPFGVLNDKENRVNVIFDKAFDGALIGVHPNENTATVFLETADLAAAIKQHCCSVLFAEF
jgi:Ala-tRNA(Pro) deacylase